MAIQLERFAECQLLRFWCPQPPPCLALANEPEGFDPEIKSSRESNQQNSSPKRQKRNFTEQCWNEDFFSKKKTKMLMWIGFFKSLLFRKEAKFSKKALQWSTVTHSSILSTASGVTLDQPLNLSDVIRRTEAILSAKIKYWEPDLPCCL